MNTCVRGHEWTPENTTNRKDGYRSCRKCNMDRQRVNRVEGKVKPLTPEQKARKSVADKKRDRGPWPGLTTKQKAVKNARQRNLRAERAWAKSFEYYTAWQDKKTEAS